MSAAVSSATGRPVCRANASTLGRWLAVLLVSIAITPAPPVAARHLRANPRARLITTPQALAELRPLISEEPEVLTRVEATLPAEGERARLARGGLTVQVLNLHHGRDRERAEQNLGFLVEMGGVRWLHVGDTEAVARDFRPYDLAAEAIDVALLPAWFLNYDRWSFVVRSLIRPREIVAMHLATPDAPPVYFGDDGGYRERLRRIRTRFPRAVILERAGSSRTFRPGSPP